MELYDVLSSWNMEVCHALCFDDAAIKSGRVYSYTRIHRPRNIRLRISLLATLYFKFLVVIITITIIIIKDFIVAYPQSGSSSTIKINHNIKVISYIL